MAELILNLCIGLIFIVVGLVMIFLPNRIYSLILIAAIFASLWHGGLMSVHFVRKHKILDFFLAISSFLFAFFLCSHQYFPEWVIRVGLGAYSIFYALCCFIQWFIYVWNSNKGRLFTFINAIAFFCVGLYLLFYSAFDSELIMIFMGIYVLLLGFRYSCDMMFSLNPTMDHSWKRRYRLSLPTVLCAFIPDWTLKLLKKSDYKSSNDLQSEVHTNLRLMVHVGPKGFQKVGHITIVFDDQVYSYGNYDQTSHRLNGTVGKGIFFIAPYDLYLPMILSKEKNTIFEYGVQLSDSQEELIRNVLNDKQNQSSHWYAPIQREPKSFSQQELAQDYANRLSYFAHADFYQIEKGRFKTYWALGSNCALFIDSILSIVGQDVLNLRNVVSPGLYLDWLQKEYIKQNSPIVSRTVHSLII